MRPDLAAQGLRDVDDGREDRERDREKAECVAPVGRHFRTPSHSRERRDVEPVRAGRPWAQAEAGAEGQNGASASAGRPAELACAPASTGRKSSWRRMNSAIRSSFSALRTEQVM